MKTNKIKSRSLAETIHKFMLADKITSSVFLLLYNSTIEELKRLLNRWSLKLVVDDQQIENAAIDFIEDVTSSPDENQVAAQLLKIIMIKSENFLNQLQFYASRRLFTLLKKHADKRSKEYIRFNNLVKRALLILSQEGQIYFHTPTYYAAANEENLPVMVPALLSSQVINQIPLRRVFNFESGHVKNHKLKDSVLILLVTKPHNCFKFAKVTVSSVLFNLNDESGADFSIDNFEMFDKNFYSSGVYENYISEGFKAETILILEQIALQFEKHDQNLMFMMGLAHFYLSYPQYFDQNDLFASHLEILDSNAGTIDKIFKFLNTIPEIYLLKDRPGRTTVHNRLKVFKAILKGILEDFPIRTQIMAIRELVEVLLARYWKIFKEIKSDKL